MPTLAVNTGFEFGTATGITSGNTGAKIFDTWDSGNSINTTSPHTGGYVLRQARSAAVCRAAWTTSTVATSAHIVFRAWVRINSISGTAQLIATDISTGSDAGIRYNGTTERFEAGVDGGTWQASTNTHATGTWHLIEFYANRSANPWVVKWRVNGVAQTDATHGLAAASSDWVFFGRNAAETVNVDYDDAAVSRTAADYPLGDGKGILLTVDPAGTVTASDGGTDFRRFTANGTIDGSWNATNVRDAVTERPPTGGATASGAAQITTDTVNYMQFPMTTYTLTGSEVVNGGRMLAAGWAASTTANTVSFRSHNGTTERTLFAAADPNFGTSSTIAYVCRMLTLADIDSQAELDALAMRVGYSSNATVDVGIHAIYVEIDVAVPTDPNATVTASTVAASTQINASSVVSDIIDNFDDNAINAGIWDNWGAGNIVESGQQLRLTTGTAAFAYYGIQHLAALTITGRYLGSYVVAAGNQALNGYGAYPVSLVFSSSNEAYWVIVGGSAFAYTNVGGAFTQRGSGVAHSDGRYYVIGEESGDVVWKWSDDGTTWNTTATLANPFGGDQSVNPYMMVGTDQANGSTTTFVVDNFGWYTTTSASTPATVSAATAPAVAAVAAPTVFRGATATPGAVAAVTAVGAATPRLSAFPAPATVAATASVAATTVRLSVRPAPASAAAVAAVGGPTVAAGAVATPAVTVAVTAVATPAVRLSSLTGPATVSGIAAVGAPTVRLGVLPSPATVASVATVGAPTVTGPGLTLPATVAGAASVGAPTVQGAALATPTTTPATVGVATPTVRLSAIPLSATVSASSVVPVPGLFSLALAAPPVVAAVAAVPGPSVQTASTASASASTVPATTTVSGAASASAAAAPTTTVAASAVTSPAVRLSALPARPTVTAAATVAAPALTAGATHASVTVTAAATVGTPAVTTGNAAVAPTVSAVATITVATLTSATRPAPNTVAATASVAGSTVRLSAAPAPATAGATTQVPAPTVRTGAAATTGTVPATAAVTGPVVGSATAAQPLTAPATAAVAGPVLRMGAAPSLGTLAASAAVSAAAALTSVGVAVTTVAAAADVGVGFASGQTLTAPDTVVGYAAVGLPAVRAGAIAHPGTVSAVADVGQITHTVGQVVPSTGTAVVVGGLVAATVRGDALAAALLLTGESPSRSVIGDPIPGKVIT